MQMQMCFPPSLLVNNQVDNAGWLAGDHQSVYYLCSTPVLADRKLQDIKNVVLVILANIDIIFYL